MNRYFDLEALEGALDSVEAWLEEEFYQHRYNSDYVRNRAKELLANVMINGKEVPK